MQNGSIFEDFFMQMSSALIVVDTENHFITANNVALKLFPYLSEIDSGSTISENEFAQLFKLLNGNFKNFKDSGRIYDVGIRKLENQNAKVIWFRDVTKEKETMAMLKLNSLEMGERIRDFQQNIIIKLAEVIEDRDKNTGGHVKRTNNIVRILLKAMLHDCYPNVSETFLKIASSCSSMHDIGKISVSDTILLKNGKLTDEEFEQMKSHAAAGGSLIERILDGIEDDNVLKIAKNIARSHHEKWNGCGYPDNLKGEEIPLEARVMAIADVYDALVSKRCYKESMPFPKAKAIMEESFGSHFDPTLKKYFEECLPQIESFYIQSNESS